MSFSFSASPTSFPRGGASPPSDLPRSLSHPGPALPRHPRGPSGRAPQSQRLSRSHRPNPATNAPNVAAVSAGIGAPKAARERAAGRPEFLPQRLPAGALVDICFSFICGGAAAELGGPRSRCSCRGPSTIGIREASAKPLPSACFLH